MSTLTPEVKFTIDLEKPMFERVKVTKDAGDDDNYECLEVLADILVEEGVEQVFNLEGSGCFRIVNPIMKKGIKRVMMAHEQELGFAADAYGRISRKPGVCLIGPGTGVPNLGAAMHQARSAQSPIVALIAGSAAQYDGRWTQQGGIIAQEVLSPLLKRPVRRLINNKTVGFQVKQAFRDAVTPQSGPIGVEIAEELTLQAQGYSEKRRLWDGYTPGTWSQSSTDMFKQGADPAAVEKALRWLLEAERPAMTCGEAIYYHDAQDELREFVNLLGIPCHTRRAGRGAIPDVHPLNCAGRARGKVMGQSDRTLVMGLSVRYLENFGKPPFWGMDAKYIQVQASPDLQCTQLPTVFEMNGNMKNILRQFIDCAKDMGIKEPVAKWQGWRDFVIDAKQKAIEKTTLRSETQRGVLPLHPDLIGRIIGEWYSSELQDDYITILGGWSATSFYSDWIRVKEAGQVLDATDAIGLGHPVPMAIGAAMADKRKRPVIALMGDGDFYGGCAMSYQAAVKWELPVIGIHVNNNSLCTNCDEVFQAPYGPTKDFYKDFMQIYPPKIRTDKMVAEMGVHGEYVEREEELLPALQRSYASIREGVPAHINIFTNPVVNNEIMGLFTALLYGNIPYNDLTRNAKELLLRNGYFNSGLAFGADVSWSQALEHYKKTGEIPELM